jgi:hypothetical protein
LLENRHAFLRESRIDSLHGKQTAARYQKPINPTDPNIKPMKLRAPNSFRSHAATLAPLLGLALLSLMVSPVEAASSITNPLTGFTGDTQANFPGQPATLAGSGLNVTFVWGGGPGAWERIDFNTSGATYGSHSGGGPQAGRNYLRTDQNDYATVGFTAYVTVNRSTRDSVFFGLGKGDLGASKAPDLGTGNASVFLDLQDGFDNASRRIQSGTNTDTEVGWNPMTTVTGPMRLRMEYDALAQTVVYAIDYAPSGAFVADQTFATVDVSPLAAEWAGGEASSIYFGGQNGVTFSNFEVAVIPEPSAALLLLGAGALGFRRRR